MAKPQPFCDVLEKLGSTKDGLADQFITVSAPAYLEGTLDSIVWLDAILNCPKDWLLIALSYIYYEHSVNGAIEFKFSEEALEELKAFRHIEKEETLTKFKEAEQKQSPDIQSLILEYPGPFVTAHMLTHRKGIPALACASTMMGLGSLPETDKNYMGMYKQLKISGKATHCFVKAKPEKISAMMLQNLNITKAIYRTFYNKDISQAAPICPNWPKYYSDVKAALGAGRHDYSNDAEL
uniref:Nucleoprotein n=1 Tax=Romanomermis culicivorax TaxID=13658 RepID=A0A915KKJ7_ROMCU